MTFTATYDTVRLPDERSGTILLFKVYDRMSYGLVVESIAADARRRFHHAPAASATATRRQTTTSFADARAAQICANAPDLQEPAGSDPGRLFAHGRPETHGSRWRARRACTPGSCDGSAQSAVDPPTLLRESRAALAALGLGDAAIEALLQPRRRRRSPRTSAGSQRPRTMRSSPGARAGYPPLLAPIPDAPLVLFVEGDAWRSRLPQLAIVGSRNPTPIGRDTATQFARHLAHGRARDHERTGARHRRRGASRRTRGRAAARSPCSAAGSIAIYPRENAALARQIVGAAARSSPTFPPARRRSSSISRAATASSAACRSGRWWSRRRCRAAR